MKIPKRLKIGACDYIIKQIVVSKDEDYVGKCYPNQQLIEIERRLPNHKKLQTLFHEILHAIAFEYGDIKIGETKIDLLATGLMSLFRDNPTLKHLL